MNQITRRMFLKWAMVAAASPGALLVEPRIISIPTNLFTFEDEMPIGAAGVRDLAALNEALKEVYLPSLVAMFSADAASKDAFALNITPRKYFSTSQN